MMSPMSPQEALLRAFSKHIGVFQVMAAREMLAPVSAYLSDGKAKGRLYTTHETALDLSADEVLTRMRLVYNKELEAGSIHSYVILYHCSKEGEAAQSMFEMTAITVEYRTLNEAGSLRIPYEVVFARDGSFRIRYNAIEGFTLDETQQILYVPFEITTEVIQGAFDQVSLAPEHVVRNAAGIDERVDRRGKLGDVWRGIFGRQSDLSYLPSWLQSVSEDSVTIPEGPIEVIQHTIVEDALTIQIVNYHGHCITGFPVVHTKSTTALSTASISEWINVHRSEAILVSCNGPSWYATDYISNRQRYAQVPNQSIALTGIFISGNILSNNEATVCSLEADFTFGYRAFHRFVGVVQQVPHRLYLDLANQVVSGYIFELEVGSGLVLTIFVNATNVDGAELRQGSRLQGMVHLQGQIQS